MSQNNALGVKSGETKEEEKNAAASSSTNSKTIQLDIQSIRLVSDTLKRNPKIELSQSDLLKLLCFLEGELQARDVVIATLRSENLKRFILATQQKEISINDPHAALFRDRVAFAGNIASKQSSAIAARCEQEIQTIADQRMKSLESLIVQQRQTQIKMVNILKNVESKQKQLVNELDEERRKHEHDTAQGDDITYGLELERTRLKQELEKEFEAKKKLEKDLKKLQEQLESEKLRQKQIVLFLLVERKKIIMKYIEERKRSEDYALILNEEKVKVDTLAEGLEEESKKSLRMEAELEKQSLTHERERETLLASLAQEQQQNIEKDMEIKQLREELEELKKSGKTNQGKFITGTIKPANAAIDELVATSNPLVKVVQPTAIAISGPVSGPTTGIAKSVVSSQNIRPANQISSIATKTVNQPQPPQPPLKKSAILSSQTSVPGVSMRGNPPPIPPNKPIIPVKRDQNSRIPFATANLTGNATANTAKGNCDYDEVSQTPMFSSNITK